MAFPTVVVVKEDGSSQTVIDVTMEDEGDVYEATTEEIECDDVDDEIDDDVMPLCVVRGCMEPVTGRAGTAFCHEHRCIFAFCKHERDAGHNFCYDHRAGCAVEGCPWKLSVDDTILGSSLCSLHRCERPGCLERWVKCNDGFCEEHTPRPSRGRFGFCAARKCNNYPLGSLVPFCAVHAQRNSDL